MIIMAELEGSVSHTHDNKAVLDSITVNKVTGWDSKANASVLTGIDINTVTTAGIYDVSLDCTGFPTLPTGFTFAYGITLIVNPNMEGYQTKYLIINGRYEENYECITLKYVSQKYNDDFDLHWSLIFNSNSVNEMKAYIDQQLGVIENGTY